MNAQDAKRCLAHTAAQASHCFRSSTPYTVRCPGSGQNLVTMSLITPPCARFARPPTALPSITSVPTTHKTTALPRITKAPSPRPSFPDPPSGACLGTSSGGWARPPPPPSPLPRFRVSRVLPAALRSFPTHAAASRPHPCYVPGSEPPGNLSHASSLLWKYLGAARSGRRGKKQVSDTSQRVLRTGRHLCRGTARGSLAGPAPASSARTFCAPVCVHPVSGAPV